MRDTFANLRLPNMKSIGMLLLSNIEVRGLAPESTPLGAPRNALQIGCLPRQASMAPLICRGIHTDSNLQVLLQMTFSAAGGRVMPGNIPIRF